MRVLFYTATIFFLTLFGGLGYFAVQPTNSGGSRVVLNIDTSGGAAQSTAGALNSGDTARSEDVRQTGEPAATVTTKENASMTGAEAEKTELSRFSRPVTKFEGENNSPSDNTSSNNVSSDSRVASTENNGAQSATTEAEPSDNFSNIPGTLVDMEPNKQQVANAETAGASRNDGVQSTVTSSDATPPSQETAPEESVAAKVETITPSSSTDQPQVTKAEPAQTEPAQTENGAGKTDTEFSANLGAIEDAVPEQPHQQAAPQTSLNAAPTSTMPIPPLPVRRPAIPAPIKTAALQGWGTEVTATDGTTGGGIRVAILIRGIGQDRRDSYDAINKLPAAISLGFVANDDGEEMAGKARELGHEVIVQLPLDANESTAAFDLLGSSTSQNAERMGTMLNRFNGLNGVTNITGGKLLQSKEALRPIMEDIKARNLVYIAEGNNNHAVVRQLAQELNVRYGNAAVVIDTHPTPDGIKAALDRLVVVAQKRGSAIGIGFANATTIEQLQVWSQELATKGVTLVPASSLSQAPGAS
jgi:polysaccharide deacetylase 2 family uncharacterized protein YibQ